MSQQLVVAVLVPTIAVATLAAATALGVPVMSWLMGRLAPSAGTSGTLRGGTWVGVLERAMVTGGILLGMPEVFAIVIAVKGLGRYPELRDTAVRSQAAERFIIGTLASLIWAGAFGVTGRWVILSLL